MSTLGTCLAGTVLFAGDHPVEIQGSAVGVSSGQCPANMTRGLEAAAAGLAKALAEASRILCSRLVGTGWSQAMGVSGVDIVSLPVVCLSRAEAVALPGVVLVTPSGLRGEADGLATFYIMLYGDGVRVDMGGQPEPGAGVVFGGQDDPAAQVAFALPGAAPAVSFGVGQAAVPAVTFTVPADIPQVVFSEVRQ